MNILYILFAIQDLYRKVIHPSENRRSLRRQFVGGVRGQKIASAGFLQAEIDVPGGFFHGLYFLSLDSHHSHKRLTYADFAKGLDYFSFLMRKARWLGSSALLVEDPRVQTVEHAGERNDFDHGAEDDRRIAV
jgi:hypothetical protein